MPPFKSLSQVYNDAIRCAIYSYRDKHRRKFLRIFDITEEAKIVRTHYSYFPFQIPKFRYPKEIVALCSTIHTPSIAAILFARKHLARYGIHISVEFVTSSAYALKEIEKYNSSNTAALVTVTAGTAAKLEGRGEFYKCQKALEAIPGYLTWTSPKRQNFSDIRDYRFIFHNHPTDLDVCNQFKHHLVETNRYGLKGLHSISDLFDSPVDFMPEQADMYWQHESDNSLLLTVDFLDDISGKRFTFPYWNHTERRFIYFNQALKYNETGYTLAKYLQSFIYDTMYNLIYSPTKEFWNPIKNDTNYYDAVRKYVQS